MPRPGAQATLPAGRVAASVVSVRLAAGIRAGATIVASGSISRCVWCGIGVVAASIAQDAKREGEDESGEQETM